MINLSGHVNVHRQGLCIHGLEVNQYWLRNISLLPGLQALPLVFQYPTLTKSAALPPSGSFLSQHCRPRESNGLWRRYLRLITRRTAPANYEGHCQIAPARDLRARIVLDSHRPDSSQARSATPDVFHPIDSQPPVDFTPFSSLLRRTQSWLSPFECQIRPGYRNPNE